MYYCTFDTNGREDGGGGDDSSMGNLKLEIGHSKRGWGLKRVRRI